MKRREIKQLPDDPELLKQLILSQNEQLQKQQSRIDLLEEQIKLFQWKRFGKSSEKSADQDELFDEAETEFSENGPDIAETLESATISFMISQSMKRHAIVGARKSKSVKRSRKNLRSFRPKSLLIVIIVKSTRAKPVKATLPSRQHQKNSFPKATHPTVC